MRTLSVLAFAALLVGCGGSGDTSFIVGSAGTINLALTAGTNYNGRTDAFASYTSLDGSAAKGVITFYVSNNDRAVQLSYVASSAKTGDSIDLSSASNQSSFVYTDTVNSLKNQWTATSGTVTVTSRTTAAVQVTLTNVVLTNVSGTSAAGTVTINGTMSFTAGT